MENSKLKLVILFVLCVNSAMSQLFPVEKNDSFGLMNKHGKLLVPYKYTFAYPFSDSMGIVAVYDEFDRRVYGYIDPSGTEIIPPVFSDAEPFHNGYAVVEKNDRIYIIDKKQNYYTVSNIYDGNYDENFVSEGLLIIQKNEKFGYSNLNDETVIPAVYDQVKPFSGGFAIVYKNENMLIIDKTGKEFETNYGTKSLGFVDGLLPVWDQKTEMWGVINNKFEKVIDFKYDYISSFKNGFASFKTEDGPEYGLMNEKGEIILEAKYLKIHPFSEGRILVQTNDFKAFLLDEKLKEIASFEAVDSDRETEFVNGICTLVCFTVKDKKPYFYKVFINAKGEILWKGTPIANN